MNNNTNDNNNGRNNVKYTIDQGYHSSNLLYNREKIIVKRKKALNYCIWKISSSKFKI